MGISTMNQKELLAFAKEAAKSMKTEKDLSNFSRVLKKVTVGPTTPL
jgi:putative transposase